MERIVSLVGDAHTYVRFPSDCPDLPLAIGRFGDEYRVTRVAKGLEKALGAKVLLIGDTPVQEARELLRPLVPQDVYENRREALVAIDFTIGCLLHGVGITDKSNAARYTLAGDDGERFTVEANAPPLHERPVEWIWPFRELPLFRQNPDRSFWQVFLPESRTLYCNVRSVRNLRGPGQELEKVLRLQAPDKLVIDLRQSPGGDYFEGLNHLIKPIAKSTLNKKGHLFVLIGPLTFSAGMANAAQFRAMTAATLVGEMIGVRPNEYSEPREVTLPNSRLTVRYSTRFYKFVESGENVVKPDLEVPTSWADYKAGRDPVLEWVLKH